MGGSKTTSKSAPVQTPQSTTAFQGGTGAASTAGNLGSNYSGQQQQLYNMLWGSPAGPSSSSPGYQLPGSMTPGAGGTGGSATTGALNQFLNPSNLNVTSPTGVYKTQNANANTAAGSQYAANNAAIKANAAQSGFGANSPTGFVQQQQNQNAQSLANTRGQNFTTATTNQYQDALNNFWKAAGAAQTGASTAQSGALQGTGLSGQLYNSLYGPSLGSSRTSTTNPGLMGILGPALGAGGMVGNAALSGKGSAPAANIATAGRYGGM